MPKATVFSKYTEKQRISALEIVVICARALLEITGAAINEDLRKALMLRNTQDLKGALGNLDIVEANLAPKRKKKKRCRTFAYSVDNRGGR